MNRVLYCVKESLRSLVQGKMMTLISIITIAIALFVVVVPLIGIVNVDLWFSQKENSATLSVYFSDTLSTQRSKELYDELALQFPSGARYSSPDDEYELFKETMGAEMLHGIEINPFGAALYVDSLPAVPNDSFLISIKAHEGVDDVIYRNEWIGKLMRIKRSALFVLAIVALVVSILVSFTISNTVKLTVYARKDLIKNMQYIGASDWYVKTPFILEGILQGVAGSFLSWFSVVLISLFITNYLLWLDRLLLLALMILFGTIIGFIGSLRAVSKFFK